MQRALLAGAGFGTAIEHAGEDTLHQTIRHAAMSFRQPDGSYHLHNRFRYLIARAEPAHERP